MQCFSIQYGSYSVLFNAIQCVVAKTNSEVVEEVVISGERVVIDAMKVLLLAELVDKVVRVLYCRWQ